MNTFCVSSPRLPVSLLRIHHFESNHATAHFHTLSLLFYIVTQIAMLNIQAENKTSGWSGLHPQTEEHYIRLTVMAV